MSNNDIVDRALSSTKEELGGEDREKHIVRAVKMMDRLEASIAEKEEDFKEWYRLHFPELVEEIDNVEHLVKILGRGVERSELDSFSGLAENSKGSALGEREKEMIESVVENLESDLELREELDDYVRESMSEEASNMTTLTGHILGAKLVALAGGLEELAKSPASTVQMLGAEKALFRYLRGKGTPPKHGVIFEHRFVNPLPESERGKMARFMANKVVMAARLDVYGDKDKGKELLEECRERFEELKA